jgi:hypothetical protein
MQSIEQFETEVATKRARLERDLALAKVLPTAGRSIDWVGVGEWEESERKKGVSKTLQILPYIVHAPFRGAEHVAFKVPAESEGGESPHYGSDAKAYETFRQLYFADIIAACKDHLLPIVALEGRYKSHQRAGWDYKTNRDYADAKEVAHGLFALNLSRGVGKYGFGRNELEFFISTSLGPVKISMEVTAPKNVDAHPQNCRYEGRDERIASVGSWFATPATTCGAVHLLRYGSGDARKLSFDARYLFAGLPELCAAMGGKF